MIEKLGIELGRSRQEKLDGEESLKKQAPIRDEARDKRDEAKAIMGSVLASGKDSAKVERNFRDADNSFFIADSRVKGIESGIVALDGRIEGLEKDLRTAKMKAYAEEGEKIIREIRALQNNLIGPIQRAWIISEAMENGRGNRLERFRIDSVRVRYTDPTIIEQKSPKNLRGRMDKEKGLPLMQTEVLVPDTRAEILEWIPYQTAARFVREGKAEIVQEREPVYDSKRVFDPIPEIYEDLVSLNLGRLVLKGAPSSVTDLAKTIGYDLLTPAMGQTVTEKEVRSYLDEVESD